MNFGLELGPEINRFTIWIASNRLITNLAFKIKCAHFKVANLVKIPDADKMVETWCSNDEIVKKTLRNNIDNALGQGAFGLPWIIIQREGSKEDVKIFGSDRIHVICALLGKSFDGPLAQKT